MVDERPVQAQRSAPKAVYTPDEGYVDEEEIADDLPMMGEEETLF